MSLHALANNMAAKGRHGDSMLVHMTPNEVAGLNALAQVHGENLTINPETGLPEAFNLKSLLPMIIGAGLTATGVGAPLAAAMVGAGYTAATGSLEKGLMAGMGAYGGAGLAGGLSAAGTAAASTAAPIDALAGMETAALETAAAPAAQATQAASATPIVDSANFSQNAPTLFGSSTPSAYYGPSSGAEAMTVGNPVNTAAMAPAAAPAPQSNFLSGMDAAALENKAVSGFNPANTDAYTNAKRGLSGLMDNPASREAFMSNVGGVGGLAKYAGAAALPAMQPEEQEAEKPAEGNIIDYSYDPISGKYRRLRSTPASQYKSTMYAKNGGITSLLSFADGGTTGDAAAIRAEIKAGPQTQAALDAALLKYTPAQMAAAFPEFGNVADFNNATLDAYNRTQEQARLAQKQAVRADMAAKGEEFRIANPGGNVTTTSTSRPTMSAIPQSEIDAARAKLTPEQRNYIDWKIEQTDPMQHERVGDQFARAGVNPYLDAAGAQAAIDRRPTGEWTDPKWRENLAAERAAEDARRKAAVENPGPFVTGPGPGPTTGGSAGSNVDPTTRAILDWYNANNGRTDPQAQADLNKWLATSGFTAAQINKALPQWGVADLQKAIDTARNLQTGSKPPTTTPPTTTPTTGGINNLPVTNATIPAYAGTNSPTGGISGLQVLTPQGVMGGSERGGTVSNVSQIIPAYQQYWQNAPVGSTVDFAGGKLSRVSGAQAVFTDKNGKTYSMGPTSDLNIIAAQNPAIGETWRSEFGMVPQNYMQGESARAYEFLRGNEPYSVNQQIKGIARPYGEMAMGLPGATFGSNAVLNQRDINEATAQQKADPANKGINIPAPQYGYGVTNPGTYNMETVYDPNTGRYITNNMYEKPADVMADAKDVKEIASNILPGGSHGVKNGGLMHMAQGGLGALAGGGAAAQYDLGGYSDGGRLLRGPGDGVSDSIPATIGNKRPARLADGEFVVPARIVSELGNGSTEAGARKLYAMMDRVQKNRRKSVGKGKVAVNSNSSKFLPA